MPVSAVEFESSQLKYGSLKSTEDQAKTTQIETSKYYNEKDTKYNSNNDSIAQYETNDVNRKIVEDKANYNKNLKGKDRLTANWNANSVFSIIDKKTTEELSAVKYWIDCGDKDFLSVGNTQLHIVLTKKNVPHEFRMRDGAHNWTYWRNNVIDGLSFISDNFRAK